MPENAAVDGSHIRALKGGLTSDLRRSTAARRGSKHHLITDRHETPLAVSVSSGNRHDVTQLMPLLDAIARIRGLVGRPRHRPRRPLADRGTTTTSTGGSFALAASCRRPPARASPTDPAGQDQVGRRANLRLAPQFKRLRIRYEIRADLHLGLLQLAGGIICLRRLRTSF
ncbi:MULTISPECIES: transposase [Streptomyces]|uniref:Transposase n=1 Tax=Streptomyces flaveolus TaxID=67297 RepID=A0ABV3AQ80_9ACTN